MGEAILLTTQEAIELLKNQKECLVSFEENVVAIDMAIQAIKKVEYTKLELANLLKCYRGDEDAIMKPMSFEDYIQEIVNKLN